MAPSILAREPEIEKPPKTQPAFPAAYALMFRVLAEVGRENGYAMGLHGSLAKDLDVIAAPWTDDAVTAEDLFRAVHERIGGLDLAEAGHPGRDPGLKPHGRKVWTLLLGGGAYIDLSVMPRSPDPEAP